MQDNKTPWKCLVEVSVLIPVVIIIIVVSKTVTIITY